MKTIRKKICIEPLLTREQGLLKYIPVDSNTPIMPDMNNSNGNWGGFVLNFKRDNTEVSFLSLMERYHLILKELLNGEKYKVINNGDSINYITHFTEYKHIYEFIPVSKKQIKSQIWTGSSDYIIVVENLSIFTQSINGMRETGIELCKYVDENIIGKLRVPSTINGDRVPSFVYYSDIANYYKWLVDNKDGKCCEKDIWESMGGEEMLKFLEGNLNLYREKLIEAAKLTYTMPKIEIPILLTQNVNEVGLMTEYIDWNNIGEIDANGNRYFYSGYNETMRYSDLSEWQDFEEGEIKTESELQGLRLAKKYYSTDGKELPGLFKEEQHFWTVDRRKRIIEVDESTAIEKPYTVYDLRNCLTQGYRAGGYYMTKYVNDINYPLAIPFETGIVFNSRAIKEIDPVNGEEIIKRDGDDFLFIGDYISAITINTGTNPNLITFDYTLGGKYKAEYDTEISGYTFKCGVEETGIRYKETYHYYPKQEKIFTIDEYETTLYCDYIDFEAGKEEVYNPDNNMKRMANISSIIGMRVNDVLDSAATSNNLVFKDDSLMGINMPEKENIDIEINRGNASVTEKRLKLSECNSYEDVKNYGNNFFKV